MNSQRRNPSVMGFTLIEMLVAVAVLMVVCVMVLQMVSNTQGAAGSSLRRLDADSQGQLALDRMFMDLSAAQIRRDLPYMVTNSADGSASLMFFTSANAASGARGVSLIGYRLAKDTGSGAPMPTGRLCLQRASRGLDWSQAGFMGQKTNGTAVTVADLPTSLALNSTDYDVLAEGVIRLAVSCQRTDGTLQVDPPLANSAPDLSQVSALVVTLVVIDARSQRLLTPQQVETIAAAFPAPVAGMSPAVAWSSIANSPANFPNLPREAVKSIRVYQRFFPLQHSSLL